MNVQKMGRMKKDVQKPISNRTISNRRDGDNKYSGSQKLLIKNKDFSTVEDFGIQPNIIGLREILERIEKSRS